MTTGVCVEWAQATARAEHWSEEVTLLVEEMRRVLHFLMWKKQWWQKQGERRQDTRSDVKEGLKAYAVRQGMVMGQLAEKFADQWNPLLGQRDLPMEWPEELRTGRKSWSGKKRDEGNEVPGGVDVDMDMEEIFDEMF
jgi:hypothetical protein